MSIVEQMRLMAFTWMPLLILLLHIFYYYDHTVHRGSHKMLNEHRKRQKKILKTLAHLHNL